MRPGNRPREIHTKHLTERERFRVRTLYYDASMSKKRIEEVTGYSISQIRTAIRAKSSEIPPRSGRPKKGSKSQDHSINDETSLGPASEDSTLVPRDSSPPEERGLVQPANRSGLNRLPPSLRRYIWHLVLTSPSSPSSSSPLSCVWWIEKVPQSPFLLAGVFPEHWETHWRSYLSHRQPAARLLCHLNREARRVVLDTFVPVWSDAGLPMLGSPVKFLWIDPRNDKIYSKDAAAAALPVLLERSRAAVLPDLGRLLAGPADRGGSSYASGGST